MFYKGWYSQAKHVISDNFNKRPINEDISLVVIHCISLPKGSYDNYNVENLFKNKLNCDSHFSFESLRGVKVSAHFFIKRDGEIVQFVSVDDRAWHAGVSSFKGQDNCNDFSIGIELQGTDNTPYEPKQYASLNSLLKDLKNSYLNIKNITGHEDIAPQRKNRPRQVF